MKTQELMYSGAASDIINVVDWADSLDNSAATRSIIDPLNEGLAHIFGKGRVHAVVSDYADVDAAITSGSATLLQDGASLGSAVSKVYGFSCSDDDVVILINPEQLQYFKPTKDVPPEEMLWDTVLFYAMECVSQMVPEWMEISIRPIALMVISQMLPVDDSLRAKITMEALELFATYYAGYEVELEELDEVDYDRLESIQPMTGTIMKSIVNGAVKLPEIRNTQHNLRDITTIANRLHTIAGISMLEATDLSQA